MKITLEHLRSLVREQLFLLEPGDDSDCIQPPDSTDAWHPRDVVPREGAWSGGDNIDSPLDHAEFETGESNAGPHVVMGFSGKPDPLDDEPIEFSPDGDLMSILSLILEEDAPGEDSDEEIEYLGPDGLMEPEIDEEIDEEEEIEREDIVLRIMGDMEEAGLTGEDGLFRHVDNIDEFEDLIRFIFQDVRLDNRQLAGIAMRIGRDFLEDPEGAADYNIFNLS